MLSLCSSIFYARCNPTGATSVDCNDAAAAQHRLISHLIRVIMDMAEIGSDAKLCRNQWALRWRLIGLLC